MGSSPWGRTSLHFKSMFAVCNNSRFLTKTKLQKTQILSFNSHCESVTDEETGPGGGRARS